MRNSITEGVIWKQLLFLFFPILLGTFFQQLYNTVDAVIVGRFLGKEALAAVGGGTAVIINLLVGFFVGLSSGATVIISQFYGAGDGRRVEQAVHTAIALALAGGAIFTGIGIIFSPGVLRLLDTPVELMGLSVTYINLYFTGMIPSLLYNMGSGILRAAGDSRRPLYYLIAGCLTNIVLDLLFIPVLHLGVAGAAAATVLSQAVSMILVVRCLTTSRELYRLTLRQIRFNPVMLKSTVKIGLPAGLQAVMYSLSNLIIQANVNSFGTNTIAAFTAYGKIDSLFWMIVNAFGISITVFSGQNYGAGKYQRLKLGTLCCLGIAAATTVFICILFMTTAPYLYLPFTDDPEVITIGLKMLYFLVPTYIAYISIEILSGAIRGTGDAFIPMIMTVGGICLLRIIWLAVAVPLHRDILTVLASYPVTWTVTSLLFILYYRYGKWRKRLHQTDTNILS